jgi:hypothetical protein
MEKFLLILITCLTMMVLLFLASESIVNQKAEHKSYCELVSMWEEDIERGIEPTKRDGHPNYKGISCEL